MTIDDELLLEFFKPDKHGKIGKNALIINIVGTRNIFYTLEKSMSRIPKEDIKTLDVLKIAMEFLITPDIVIFLPTKGAKEIAIELENDIAWDFGKSLRQVHKYKETYPDTRVIIPEKYKRFAPLYKNEGFRVYVWKAKRKWQCLRCGTINLNESRIPPKCNGKDSEGQKCTNKSRDEFDLVGLEDAEVKEYE